MKGISNRFTRSILSSAILAAAPTLTIAQEGETLVLEEVLVVATKRTSNLQDVAVAVSALSADMMSDNQIVQTADISNLVASLTVQQGGNPANSSFNVRGLGTQSFSEGVEPSVSTLVDGVVMGRSAMAFGQLPDVERVEVLRGPQGTLFGKNASAGVVNIITKKPTQTLEGELSLIALEDSEYRAAATISGPITDNLGFRLTGSYIDADGWIENVYDGKDYNDREEQLFKGKLQWLPTGSLAVTYTYDWQDMDCNCTVSPVREAGEPAATMLLPVVASDDNNKINTSQTPTAETESSGHVINIDWDIGNHTLTSITAWRTWEFANDNGLGLLPEDPLQFSDVSDKDQEQFTQELRLTSPADQFISYVAGLYYFDQTVDSRSDRIIGFIDSVTRTDITVDTINYAAFGEAVVNLSTDWRLIVGGRYTNDELDYDYQRLGGNNPVDPVFSDGTDEDDLSGKLALQWDINNDIMTYLSYAQGYKGPAYSLTSNTDVETLEPVEPENSDAWELGVKSVLLDGSMSLNLALFMTDFENFQAESFIPGEDDEDPGAFQTTNAGEVSTQGVELDISWRATENLTIYGGIAYINAEIDDYPAGPCSFGQQAAGEPPSCADPIDGGTGTQDLSGGDLPHSPDWRITMNANYFVPLESMPFDMILKGNYRWQDDVLFDLSQDEGTIQKSYDILDLSIELRDKEDHYSVVAFVKNAADQDYVTSIRSSNVISFPGGGYSHTVPRLAERTFGVELRYSWF